MFAVDAIRHDVRRDPALDLGDRRDLGEREPADLDRPRLDRRERPQPLERLLDRVLGRPRPRRVAADAVEDDPRVQVAEAAGLDRVVGRLEQDREPASWTSAGAVEERRQRAELGRQLLLAERKQREVDLQLDCALVERPRELEHHGEPALHVARAEPDAPRRPRSGRGCSPGRERCRSGRRARRAAGPRAAGAPRRRRRRPRTPARTRRERASGRGPRSPPRCGSRTGMSTSSSVRAASRSARDGIGASVAQSPV